MTAIPVFGPSADDQPPERLPFQLRALNRDGSRTVHDFTVLRVMDSRTMYGITSSDQATQAAAAINMVEGVLVDDDGVSARRAARRRPDGRWEVAGDLPAEADQDIYDTAAQAAAAADAAGSSLRRWRALFDPDSDAIVEFTTLMDVTKWLMEAASGRPTKPPQPSPPRWPGPAGQAPTSAVGSRSQGS